jgi:hypothetical protein
MAGVVVGWVAGRVDEVGAAGRGVAVGVGLAWAERDRAGSSVEIAKPAAMRSRIGAELCIWFVGRAGAVEGHCFSDVSVMISLSRSWCKRDKGWSAAVGAQVVLDWLWPSKMSAV